MPSGSRPNNPNRRRAAGAVCLMVHAGLAALLVLLGGLGADVVRIDRTEPSGLGVPVATRFDVTGRGRRSVALAVPSVVLPAERQGVMWWVVAAQVVVGVAVLLGVLSALLTAGTLKRTPSSTLVICFGMGTTFRSLTTWGGRTTAVELVPSVADAFGNPVSGSNVTLALVGTGTLTGGAAQPTNASGMMAAMTVNVASTVGLPTSSTPSIAATSGVRSPRTMWR